MDTFSGSQMNNRQAEGLIGFYGLSDWWFAEFTEAERKYIEKRYSPVGTGDNARPLTHGKILVGGTGRASQLLWGLATWFKKPTDFRIAERILKKAEEVAFDPLDFHFTYQQMIQVYYRVREIEPKALDNAIEACKKQIQISSQVSERMKGEYPGLRLPSHIGYKQLAIILEKQKNYAEVIRLLNQAQVQGWKGDWEDRIARCEQKILKSQNLQSMRIKRMPEEQFIDVLKRNWLPVQLIEDAIPTWLRNIPKDTLHSVYASGGGGIPTNYSGGAIPSGVLIGGIDVYRNAPDDPVELNKDWYPVFSATDTDAIFLVAGPIRDVEHWLNEIPSQLNNAEILAVPPASLGSDEDTAG
jgi:hypothetical protein